MSLRQLLQTFNKLRVQLDSNNSHAALQQVLGHFAVPGPDFDPTEIVPPGFTRKHAVRGNVDRSRDLLLPPRIAQKMLPQFLSCHEWLFSLAGTGLLVLPSLHQEARHVV